MKRRSYEELNSPERAARLMMRLQPTSTPKVIRNYIRNHYAVELVDWLRDVAMGEVKFPVTDSKGRPVVDINGRQVEVAAPAAVRKECAVAVVNFATIGANVHHLGDDNEALQGAIALPELELANQQRRLSPGAGGPRPAGINLGDVNAAVDGLKPVVDEYTIDVPKPAAPKNGNGHHPHNGNGHHG